MVLKFIGQFLAVTNQGSKTHNRQNSLKGLKQETVVAREALDRGRFASDGGFERLNKTFDGKLVMILGDLRESIWSADAS
ncbi:MAG: hypothetical protein MK135_14000 [Polyangiaceae bacterium]|nr:hypothetical protein [Polyangiaceae bacterium]